MKQKLLVVLVLLLTSAGLSLGQAVDSQQIFGTVTDPSGAAIPNAEIVVLNEATGIARTVKSNAAGNYVVLNVPVGVYTLTTTIAGFKKSALSGVHVDIGSKPEVPISLTIGQATETVEVQANVVTIQTTTAEIGGVITSTEATQIQLNGRNYVQLLTLQPGVSTTVASGFNIFGTYGVNGNSQSVNGIRSDSANYFIDGVDNKDNGGGGNNFVNISPDSLQQFRNVASSYDASYGGTAGATVAVAIKSGGRDFHGSAYEHIRNDAIQAYPYRFLTQTTNPIKAPLRYNDFGWTLGGPVWIPGVFNRNRDKLFFFAAQEFKRLRNSTATIVAVPKPSDMATALSGPTTATGRALAATVLTDPTGNYSYLSLNNNNQSEWLIKVDYNLNEKNQISGRFVHDNVLNVGNPTNFVIYDRTIPGLTSSASWTHTFNSKIVNVLTGSYSGNIINEGNNIRANPQFRGAKILRSDFGLNYTTLYNASNIIPQITLSGYSNPNVTPRQFDNSQRIYAVKDDLSIVLGNHSVKVGAYFWRARKNQTAPPALNGQFTFNAPTGSTNPQLDVLRSLVSGNFTNYTEGSNIPQIQARFPQFETYVQDDWTLTRRLTVNLGLRWQLMPPISSWPNNTAFFDPTLFDQSKAATIGANGSFTSNPSPYNGLVLPGTGFTDKAKQVVSPTVYNNPAVQALFRNRPGGIVGTKYNTFAPRVGFAYDLTGKQSTVLHGGYGMSYERVQGNYIYGAASQLPFTAVASLASAGNADNLGSIGATATPTNITNSAAMNLEPPRIQNYSFGLQQKLLENTSFELNYVGSRSTNLTYRRNLNQAAAGTEQANPTVTQRNALRPYRGYGEIYQYTNGAHSNYNSLQARIQTRFRSGGLVSISYTWSKSLTMGSTFDYQPQDSNNLAADYGPANFSQPQIFVVSYVYPLPFWRNQREWYKRVLGDWQVSGLTRIASGLPINVIQASGLSVAGNLVTTSNVPQRPNLVGDPYARRGKQYLNPAAFATPAPGTYGNLGYDAIKGPLFNNWDAALQKNFVIHEQVGVDFRAEMFNVPNHMSMFTIANTLGATTFGQVTSSTGATDPRTMEFVLRAHF